MNRRDFVLTTAAGLAAGLVPQGVVAKGSRSSVDRRSLQRLVDETAKELGVVGAQMALFDGSEVHEFATGLRDLERGLATTGETVFQIGSTTKLFNAALIMTLVDEGVLDLDAPVKTWIGDFRLADADATEKVTLRQLLSMSAGIDNGSYHDYGRGDDAVGQYVAALAGVPVIFAPGTAFGYSNASTNISGLAAQRATRENWETLLADRILKPLSLTQSANFPEDLLSHAVALGYSRKPGAPAQRIPVWGLPRGMAPAGGTLCCSAGDLVRFARMFLARGKSKDGRQVVSEASIRTMHTPQVTLPTQLLAHKWCTGPYWKQWGGKTIYGHSGTNTGGSSMLLWCPEQNFAIATIANVANQGYPFADRIFNTVFPELFGVQKPVFPKPAEVTPAKVELTPYAGRFEALGNLFTFKVENGRLIGTQDSGGSRARTALTSEFIPLGANRFLPADPAMSGNRGWDVAFWGDDGNGRPSHYLNGVFAMRRTG